ncbi:MAG: ArsI/CadI family heavy metal resistance metalloenzyme [Casimicrobiaceae bacterium]
MKRFHVHIGVPDLAASVHFYSGLFGMPPTVTKTDYAKWMLEDPRVNFAISHRGARVGVNHLGLQADNAEELADLRTHFAAADASSVVDENEVSCCYARSDKHWVRDPQGIAWEAFHSLGDVPLYDGSAAAETAPASCGIATSDTAKPASTGGCCGPAKSAAATKPAAGCCTPA